MRKRIVQGITLIGLMMFCMGCSKKIANDEISIQKYKGLEVAEESSGEISEEKVWEALMAECTVDEFPEDEVTELIEQLVASAGNDEESVLSFKYAVGSISDITVSRSGNQSAGNKIAHIF